MVVKLQIIESFSNTASPLRIMVVTVAFGMGVDIPDVQKIVPIYVQETRRGGRDGKLTVALLLTQ